MKKIAILFPTYTEAKYFNRENVICRFTGVGISSAAYATYKTIVEDRPDVIIMCGIAGVYAGSKFKKYESVLVRREHEADCGFFTKDGYKHLSDLNLDMSFEVIPYLDCPYVKKEMPLPLAVANTMNSALSPYVNTKSVDVESMEGFPFFYTCLKENVEFYELRTISNSVDVEDEDWDYDTSLQNMTSALNILIDFLIK